MANPSGPATSLDSLTVSGVPTIGASGLPLTAGNYWFVGTATTGSNGNTGASNSPFLTIEQALLKAVTGDVIVLQPGFAETVSTAGQIAISTAGITIWGIGEGANQPTLTFSATAATVLITGASCFIGGSIIGVGSVASIVSPFVVQANFCTIDITWRDGSAILDAVHVILTSAAASNLTVNLTYLGFTTSTHVVSPIKLIGVVNGTINVDFYGTASTAVVEFATTACVNIQVNGTFYNNASSAGSKNVVDSVGGSTWFIQAFDGQAGYLVAGGSASAVGPAFGTASSITLEQSVSTAAAVMSNALNVFTIAGGPIQVLGLVSICATANNATASTLQWESLGTLGATTQTITGASATLASATAGTSVIVQGTALSTAPVINTNGAGLAETTGIVVPAGTLTLLIGVGSTTGTWSHYLRYRPLAKGVTVTNAF